MTKPSTKYSTFADFVLSDSSAESIEEKLQLIRILSRSSTLPKVEGIYIKSFPNNPDVFYIDPGHAILIGKNLLKQPIAALFYLRYGLEWQIWYKSQSTSSFDPRICDLAACRVTAKFYELIPPEDRIAIQEIPKNIAEVILKFKSSEKVENLLSSTDFETLGILHHHDYPSTPIDQNHLDVLNHLASPVEQLMTSDGDLRLTIDPDQLLNVYGCRPFPRPEAFTFASSTATSISTVAYNEVELKRESLIAEALKIGIVPTALALSTTIKTRLKENLTLPESTKLILAPSGTDISLQVAGICQAVFDKKITHVLVAADETGSGVPLALQGKHFSDRTARNFQVQKEATINGFKETEVTPLKLRDENGQIKPTAIIDNEVMRAVKAAFDQDTQPVLHVMDQSKMGYSAPSEQCLQQLREEYGDQLVVLIDNSQLRMDQSDIKKYTEKGYMMTITGSKFFTGPPFNGALIIPENLKQKWTTVTSKLPEGLQDYYYKNEWPEDWSMASPLKEGISFGVSMRWYSSVIEISRYFNTPLSLRHIGLEMFCDHVATVVEQTDYLEHLPDFVHVDQSKEPQKIKDRRTIFPFFVKTKDGVLERDKVKKLYLLLNQDLSDWVPSELEEAKRLAAQACHIGQPVKIFYKDGTPTGVIRISLGARVISDSWKDQDASVFFRKIETQMTQVDIIIRKIKLILDFPEWLEEKA